jgi:hypothetical protein
MALLSQKCPECRALVPVADMALHQAWHNGLQTALAGHPHAARAAEAGQAPEPKGTGR